MVGTKSARYVAARALEMRHALELICKDSTSSAIAQFPKGCAISASLMLGAWFVDHSIDGFDLVAGCRPSDSDSEWVTHHWLSRGDLIVDITADQFGDAPLVPIVEIDSAWHDSFTPTGLERSDFRRINGASHLSDIYALLVGIMNAPSHAAI
ncbi:MAG: hypothetical protein AAAFM81_08500 [Pseudomonadota bacterium]